MMTRMKYRILSGLLLLTALVGPSPVVAQDSIDEFWGNSLTAMRAGEWAKAHDLLAKACARFDARAPTIFGPKFGWFWYHKGYCELKMKQWEEAMKSFEVCYKKYPNKNAGAAGQDPAAQGSFNHYHKKALLKWGDAAIGAQEWDLAVRQYKKFLEERDQKRDTYQRGAFNINMSMAHFKLDKISDGIGYLETAITNKETFPTPDEGIMVGFQALVEAVIAKPNEQALVDFLNKNRADVILDPFQMHKFATVFMKLAADALEAELDRSAFELYAMVPSTRAAIDDIEARLKQIGNIERRFADPPRSNRQILKGDLVADLEELKKQWRSGDPHEVIATAATAYIHENAGNVRGAFAAYEQLEHYHSGAEKREKYLYNLVRTSAIIGEVLITEKYGSRFLNDFPGSDHEESVRSMMLTSLFLGGEYAKCIEVGNKLLNKIGKPSKQHDICVHVLGGSYYYTGEYLKARPHLDLHVKEYPKSQFRMASLYFQGSNLSRLQYWGEAAVLLDDFLTKYPKPAENMYLPFALYDRSNCHFAENELDPALVKLNRIEKEFPHTPIMDMAYNLKGNVFETQNEWDPAEEYYRKALALAERLENTIVAGESLYYLVGLLGVEKRGKEPNPRVADAVKPYDKFWKEHGSDSPYKAQVAVAGLHALTEAGRGQEALDRLQGVIAQLAAVQGSWGLEEAINSYTKAYLKNKTPKQLKDHYYDFPGIDSSKPEAQALLRIALITVFEQLVKKSKKEKDDDGVRDAEAMIGTLFEDLRKTFDTAEMTNYILVRLGDHLREKANNPTLALTYYDAVIGREDGTYKFNAHFGRADILGREGRSSDEKRKAIESLKHVYEDAPQERQKEKALHRIVEITASLKEWNDLLKWAKVYLKENKYRTYSSFVSLHLATAFDKLGKREDAITAYGNVVAVFAGHIEVSATACHRFMSMVWDRNAGNDHQVAYEYGYEYCKNTTHLRSMMTEKEIKLWDSVQSLTVKYEDHSSTEKIVEKKED